MTLSDPLSERTMADADEELVAPDAVEWDEETDVLVVGAGGCGLTTALAASADPDVRVTVLEKTREITGATSLSSGGIPAGGTRFQDEAGIDDSAERMARDILAKNGGSDEAAVRRLCEVSSEVVHWLVDDLGLPLSLFTDFTWPGFSEHRLHFAPEESGSNIVEPMVDLLHDRPNVEILLNSPVVGLVGERGRVDGAVADRNVLPADVTTAIRAGKVVLACDGFASNPAMVDDHCGPEEITEAYSYCWDGNTGDGIRWGAALGGRTRHMDSYQAHATVTVDAGIISKYGLVLQGGFIVDRNGERFSDETAGYSSVAIDVLQRPGGYGYVVFDEAIHDYMLERSKDFREAVEVGAYRRGEDARDLAETLGCDPDGLERSLAAYNEAARTGAPDETGRTDVAELEPPLYGAQVTGSLFHTQGGLVVDDHARVLDDEDDPVENLYAGGGSAVGVSGPGYAGYLAGNGLLTAFGYGYLAGVHARESL
jgi:fumarate reductase flavoprotein subunit